MRLHCGLLFISALCFGNFVAMAQPPAVVNLSAPTTLKAAFGGGFFIGAAINADQITGVDARGDAIVVQQFNSITPENVMKWEAIHPRLDEYDFTLADQFVKFGLWGIIFAGIHRRRIGYSRMLKVIRSPAKLCLSGCTTTSRRWWGGTRERSIVGTW